MLSQFLLNKCSNHRAIDLLSDLRVGAHYLG